MSRKRAHGKMETPLNPSSIQPEIEMIGWSSGLMHAVPKMRAPPTARSQ